MIVRTDRPFTANELLRDRAIMHAHYLEGLKKSVARKVVALLNDDVLPDLADRLDSRLERIRGRGPDAELTRTQRYRDLLSDLRDVLGTGMRSARDATTELLVEIGDAEARWERNAIDRVLGPKVRFELNAPAASTLRSVVTARPMDGRLLSDWFDELGKRTQARVERAINIGIVEGESTDELVRRIRGTREERYKDGVLQITRNNAEAVVRTAVNHVSTHAREETYRENRNVVKLVQIVATLDLRTTDICKSLDGQTFEVGKGRRPPFHFGCRSTTVPVLAAMRGEFRASMDGEVAGKISYPEWLRGRSIEEQDIALGGPGRGAAFRRGVIGLDQFSDKNGRRRSLREIEALEERAAA